ncbi:Imm49 family immunity protein [Kitasatospora sp. NPDC101183]|uniref:Imm49 family immunity protein n=1 Tax=Kitasatospora sp. NPDC101183 TaxID=3364100 RepID=UPI0037F1C8BC
MERHEVRGELLAEALEGFEERLSTAIRAMRGEPSDDRDRRALAAVEAGLARIRIRGGGGGEHPYALALEVLRAVLAGDREAYGAGLAALLPWRDGRGGEPGPASLLPRPPLALAAIAHRRRGWLPGIGTDHLPHALVTGPARG